MSSWLMMFGYWVIAMAPCVAAETYAITEAAPEDFESYAFAINNSGQVAGSAAQRPFLWTPQEGFHELPDLPGSNGGAAYAINDAGQVAGCSGGCIGGSCGLQQAFVYRDGTLVNLNAGPSSCARAINLTGMAVGDSGAQAFIWNNGTLLLLDDKSPEADVYYEFAARAVNDSGLVVGSWNETRPSPECYHSRYPPCHFIDAAHTFEWAEGSFRILDLGPDATVSAINASGAIGANFQVGRLSRAFLRTSDGALVDLGALNGHNSSSALGINNSNDVVGTSSQCDVSTCVDTRAFLYRNGTMIDLNGQIGESGWRLTVATAINDRGQIACIGRKEGNPLSRALLLTRRDGMDARGRMQSRMRGL